MIKLAYISTNLRRYTFQSPKIKTWVELVCIGKTLNLFAGKTMLNIDEYRVDIDKSMIANEYSDAYNYINKCKTKYETILLDPPYAYRKAMEMYNGNYTSKFKMIANKIKELKIPRVISMGYHSTFMGKIRGYTLNELCVFGHGGAQHCTIGIVEEFSE